MGVLPARPSRRRRRGPGPYPRLIDEVVEGRRDEREADPLPRWVHLRNATFLTGATAQTMHYELWRGRLADVVGWSLSILLNGPSAPGDTPSQGELRARGALARACAPLRRALDTLITTCMV
ncbi:hypothetical protein ACFQ60_05945 [Streptomyces zhihengii]